MPTIREPAAPAPACTMPAHGRADAVDACCRPEGAAPPVPSASTAFWRHRPTWRRAAVATAHCLLGCAIGDIAAMTLVPVLWPAVPMPVLMAIAIVSGLLTSLLLETLVLRLRERMAWRLAVRTAMAMSFLSMVAMEIAMNATDWWVMGGMRMPLDSAGYWLAWLPALAVGFLVPLPYNYRQLRRHGRSCH
jgi:hypothetical protein